MGFVGGIIDGAPEYIEHAAIHLLLLQTAQAAVQFLRFTVFQIVYRTDFELPQIFGDALADTRYYPQIFQNQIFHRPNLTISLKFQAGIYVRCDGGNVIGKQQLELPGAP